MSAMDQPFDNLRRRLRLLSLDQQPTLLDQDSFSWFALTDPRYIAAIQTLAEDRALNSEQMAILTEIEQALPTRQIIPEGYCTLDRITLLVAQACNARCVYCYAGGGSYSSKPMLMTLTTAQDTVRFFLQRFPQIKQIQFFGGEPLLNVAAMKHVMEFVTDLHDTGQIAHLPCFTAVTNLTLLPPELPNLLEKFQLELVISIDGPALIHNQLRPLASGEGSFERMFHNVRRIQQITGGRQPEAAEVTYTAKHAQLGISPLDVYNFIQESLRISKVLLTPVETDDPALRVADDMWYESIRQIIQLGYQAYCEGNLVQAHRQLSPWLRGVNPNNAEPWECDLFCTAGMYSFAVDARGDIYPCQKFIGHPQFCMGSVAAGPDVFSSDTFDRVQRKVTPLIRKDYSECLSCPIRTICAACPAQWILASSSLASPIGPWCDLKREFKIHLIALSLKMQEEHPDRWHQLASAETPVVPY